MPENEESGPEDNMASETIKQLPLEMCSTKLKKVSKTDLRGARKLTAHGGDCPTGVLEET